MSWNMIARPIATADMGTANIYQTVTSPARRYVNAAVAGVVFYANPAFTNLFLRVYSDSAGVPGALLTTSDPWAKADILTLAHGYKSIGFTFPTGVAMTSGGVYHFVLHATGYTGDESTHIAWRLSYPDPQYTTGITTDAAHADNHPLELSLIGTVI